MPMRMRAFVENIDPNALRPKPTNVYIHVRHVSLGIQTTHTFHQRVRDTSVESPPSNEHHIKKTTTNDKSQENGDCDWKDCVTKIRMNEAMNKTEQAHIDVPTGMTETWPKLQGTYPATHLAQGAEYQYLKVTMS